MSTVKINELPSMTRSYARAALKKNQRNVTQLPACPHKFEGLSINANQLEHYRNHFNLNMPHGLPAPFMYLATQSMQLYMLTTSGFPLSPAGLVHLGIAFKQESHLPHDWKGSLSMSISSQKATKKGLVFDILTEFFDSTDSRQLTLTNTYLAKAVRGQSQADLPKLIEPPQSSTSPQLHHDAINLDKKSGRRYAKISGDYNPIHLYSWTSKLFGFRRPIIHGLYMVSKAYAGLEKTLKSHPNESLFEFKSPLYLPGSAEVVIVQEEQCQHVIVSSQAKTHLIGSVF